MSKRHVKRFATYASVLALSLGTAVMVPSASHADSIDDVESFLEETRSDIDAPGMAYSIISGDDVHFGHLGVDGDGEAVTEHTPFMWGSVAKPVTAALIMGMVERDEIALDDPVVQHLPSFELADDEPIDDITVRHLLDQTSGLPVTAGGIDDFSDRDDPYAAAVKDIAGASLHSPPGEQHLYNSSNYVLLGALIEEVRDSDFASEASRNLFGPMNQSGLITHSDQAQHAPEGHSYAYGQAVPTPLEYDDAGASYGYLGGDIRQLTAFAALLLNEGAHEEGRLLHEESVADMQTGSIELSDTVEYGFGLRIDERNSDLGETTIWHGGAVNGFFTTMVLLPDSNQAIVVMQNIYGFFHDSELAMTGLNAARLLAGGDPVAPPANTFYLTLLTILTAVVLILAITIGVSLQRFWRLPKSTESRKHLLAGTITYPLLGAALIGAVMWVPLSMGARPSIIRIWATDIGWLMLATAALGGILGLMWLIGGPWRLRLVANAPPESPKEACGPSEQARSLVD